MTPQCSSTRATAPPRLPHQAPGPGRPAASGDRPGCLRAPISPSSLPGLCASRPLPISHPLTATPEPPTRPEPALLTGCRNSLPASSLTRQNSNQTPPPSSVVRRTRQADLTVGCASVLGGAKRAEKTKPGPYSEQSDWLASSRAIFVEGKRTSGRRASR